MTDQPIEALAAEMKGKSLGEKLYRAVYPGDLWNLTTEETRTMCEKAAIVFAASLSHDETATAVIAAQAEEIERRADDMRRALAENVRLTEEVSTLSARLVEREQEIERLRSEHKAMRSTLSFIDDLPVMEINPSNYDHEIVCELSSNAVQAALAAHHTLADLSPSIRLDAEDSAAFVAALVNPAEPNDRLKLAAAEARLVESEAREGALREAATDAAADLKIEARANEMSANIMRDPARTGGWTGAENTAKAFDRQGLKAAGIRAKLLAALTTQGRGE